MPIRPVDRPTGGGPPAGEPVCGRCRTWRSCCYCDADVTAMRDALRRIAELHSGCRAGCPERDRLAAVPRGHRPWPTAGTD